MSTCSARRVELCIANWQLAVDEEESLEMSQI